MRKQPFLMEEAKPKKLGDLMSLNKKFGTDKQLEQDGVIISYEDAGKQIAWIKCRRPGGRNSLFQKVLNQKLRDNRQGLAADEDGSLDHRLLVETYAEAVIVDWGGEIEGPDGEIPAACTRENAVWLFIEEAPDLFRDLQARLQSRRNWQAREDEAKNSGAASSMSSDGGSKKKK